jgi:hypothetical protein
LRSQAARLGQPIAVVCVDFFEHLQSVACHLQALAALFISKEDRRSQIRAVTREPAIFAAPTPDVGVCQCNYRKTSAVCGIGR